MKNKKAQLVHLATRIFDVPLAIRPEKLEAILHAIGPRIGLEGFDIPISAQMEIEPTSRREYHVDEDGVACIPVQGTLMKKSAGLWAISGCSSYEQIGQYMQQCMADPDTKGILLDVDSPGGETHGVFELADMIRSMRGDKPIFAIANDMACSAAYAIASAADRVFVTLTGAVGSIGVYALHVDQSGLDEAMGTKFTYIHAGDKKIDGNPHEPLSRSARKDAQAEVDREFDIFVACVAQNRNASEAAIRNLEAEVQFAERSVPLLSDEVGTYDDARASLVKAIAKKQGSSNGFRASAEVSQTTSKGEGVMPAIPPHKTATVKKAWDGPRAKRDLRADGDQAYYEKAYAFRHADRDPNTKSGYSFIHHEVSTNGDIGAANLTGCSSGIGIINGGRGGKGRRAYTLSERRGIYRHLAKHLRDGGEQPPDLKTQAEYEFIIASQNLQAVDPEVYSEHLKAATTVAQN